MLVQCVQDLFDDQYTIRNPYVEVMLFIDMYSCTVTVLYPGTGGERQP